jgi:hypothetical protein
MLPKELQEKARAEGLGITPTYAWCYFCTGTGRDLTCRSNNTFTPHNIVKLQRLKEAYDSNIGIGKKSFLGAGASRFKQDVPAVYNILSGVAPPDLNWPEQL